MQFFKGGVHPYEGKRLSEDKPIKPLTPGAELVYPMSQHIGAPAKPCVAKGDRVLVGQIIGEAGGFVSSNIVSSVSGSVKSVEPRTVANGTSVMSVIVENDGNYESVEGFGQKRSYADMSRQEILDIIKDAGIVGMGGAGFPAHVKLAADPEKIDRIIINASECEPYLTSDYRIMLERGEELVGGLKIILKLFPKAEGIIAVEDNKPKAIAHMKELTAGEQGISVAVLKTKYPQGAERMLIYAVTKRKINSHMLPADAGCIVHNVDTACSIYRAVCLSTPCISRIITVTGDAAVDPCNFDVPLGMSLAEVAEAAGGFSAEPEKIISGGPMMGVALASADVPVTKGTTSVLAYLKDEAAEQKTTKCIRCGRCVEVCPGNVMPQKLAVLAAAGKYDEFIEHDGLECCSCGCCSYICPAKRPLTQTISAARAKALAIMKERRNNQKG